MADKMDIINMALANLGQESISSLHEDSKTAFQLRVNYDVALDDVLRSHDWGFAIRRGDLARVDEQPRGVAYSYAYPADCVRVLRVVPIQLEYSCNKVPFEIGRSVDGRHKVIWTNCPPGGWLEYITKLLEPTEFDPKFAAALSWRLAAAIALGVYNDPQSNQAATQTYAALLQDAMASDLRETSFPRLPDGEFLEVRRY